MPVYETEWPTAQPMQNMQIMSTGVRYNGTIYSPFDNTVPSEVDGVGAGYSPLQSSGPRKLGSFDNPTDPGSQSNESPVGEPWIMILFALMFAGVTALKHRNKLKTENRE